MINRGLVPDQQLLRGAEPMLIGEVMTTRDGAVRALTRSDKALVEVVKLSLDSQVGPIKTIFKFLTTFLESLEANVLKLPATAAEVWFINVHPFVINLSVLLIAMAVFWNLGGRDMFTTVWHGPMQ